MKNVENFQLHRRLWMRPLNRRSSCKSNERMSPTTSLSSSQNWKIGKISLSKWLLAIRRDGSDVLITFRRDRQQRRSLHSIIRWLIRFGTTCKYPAVTSLTMPPSIFLLLKFRSPHSQMDLLRSTSRWCFCCRCFLLSHCCRHAIYIVLSQGSEPHRAV